VGLGVSLDGCGNVAHIGILIHDLPFTRYYSGDQIKKHEIGRHVTPTGEKKVAYRILSEKSKRKRSLGIKHRWEYNIK
jgi:hypothetical protein